MTTYDYEYETVDEPRRHRSHRHRKDDREPRYADEARYVETQETYIRSAAPTKSYAPDGPSEKEKEKLFKQENLIMGSKICEGRPVERNPLASAMVGAAGAFAAYEGTEIYDKHGNKEKKVKKYAAHRDRNGEVQESYYSDDEEIKPEKKKGRRKSIVEGAMALAGLGAAAKGAAKAALLAGAAEAFRVRNEPGAWGGEKGKRILTAAIGAGSIDAAIDRDADKKSKRHILEAVVGGLVGNRAINGSRKESKKILSLDVLDPDLEHVLSSRGGGGGIPFPELALNLADAEIVTAAVHQQIVASAAEARVSVQWQERVGCSWYWTGAGAAANEIGRSRDRSRSRNRDNYDDYDSYDDHPRRSKGQRGDNKGWRRNKKIAEGKNGYDSDDSLISSSEDERRVKKMKARSHRH
ncbi:hypothetical protein DID88_003429 [Monilinia fructigena]|uniref:Uncharacterized protein n=1 Tax=Monilinia fructigena TaxID=38457 RepID=A0A395IV99_9HELO|nr:hypothetical protein DID88_003429 [Monilinia fructigena]